MDMLFSHFYCIVAYLVHPCYVVFHVALVFEFVLTLVAGKLFFRMHLADVSLHVCCLVEMFFIVATREQLFAGVRSHVIF